MINWFDVPSESPNKDLTLKNLKVSENGTYGESGVAYSSVEVDVSGGGGSSDFSTATVVVTNNLVVDVFEIKDLVNIDENGLVSRAFANASETKTISVVLYKDFPTYGYYRGEGAVAVTGNIRFENGDIYVTGDGTITLGTPE